MTDFFDGEVVEPVVFTTPNIDFHLNKFAEGEYLKDKYIPDKALFAHPDVINNFKSFYENNVDIPILVYGEHGIGKLTCIIGLINNIPCYLPDFSIDKKVNNIKYFKILDADYNKILFYENVYFLNLEVLNNHTEILNYLKYIYQIAKSSNINVYSEDELGKDNIVIDNVLDNINNVDCQNDIFSDMVSNYKKKKKGPSEKKIIIITHIDKCNLESQHYIAFMLDKINIFVSYILTSHNTNTIDKKIVSSCAPINFKHLEETDFIRIFKCNYKSILQKENHTFTPIMMKQLYNMYVSNRYNIGNTISQIKYYLATEGTEFLKCKQNTQSLMTNIAANFIKKKLVLSNISSALEIRKFLYTMLSLNMKLIIFVKEVVRQLLKSKLSQDKKLIILEKSATLSKELYNINKEVVIIEAFFYDIISVIYQNNKNTE